MFFSAFQTDVSQKSDKSSPKWFMVDVTFSSRVNHFVPLSLLKHISAGNLPDELAYIGSDGANAIKSKSGTVSDVKVSVHF